MKPILEFWFTLGGNGKLIDEGTDPHLWDELNICWTRANIYSTFKCLPQTLKKNRVLSKWVSIYTFISFTPFKTSEVLFAIVSLFITDVTATEHRLTITYYFVYNSLDIDINQIHLNTHECMWMQLNGGTLHKRKQSVISFLIQGRAILTIYEIRLSTLTSPLDYLVVFLYRYHI